MAVADDFLNQDAERCFGINDLICGYFAAGKMRAAAALRGFESPHNGQRRAEAAFSVDRFNEKVLVRSWSGDGGATGADLTPPQKPD